MNAADNSPTVSQGKGTTDADSVSKKKQFTFRARALLSNKLCAMVLPRFGIVLHVLCYRLYVILLHAASYSAVSHSQSK